MNTENCVIFKGSKDGISILMDPDISFQIIKDTLEKKIEDSSKFFEGVKTSVLFKGRALSEQQEYELLKIISNKTSMNITFFKTESDSKDKLYSLLDKNLNQQNITKFFNGNVRSGQVIEFEGSVVIIGDVNPGAEVRAYGNIIILGALKGLAHAGYNGLKDAFVAAVSMTPVQLRICDVITRFPEEEILRSNKTPEYAYLENNQIYVLSLV